MSGLARDWRRGGTAAACAWTALEREARRLRARHLRDLVREPGRFAQFSFALDDLTLDLSREKLDSRALDALLALARAAGVEERRDAMFAGAHVNLTEDRAALHMALRGGAPAPPGDDVSGMRRRFLDFAEAVRDGSFAAAGGPVTDVVHIGIGGSGLGPEMVARALEPDRDGPRLHFVSNVDGAHLGDTLRGLDAARTLVIVASKTFATLETMANARAARAWLAAAIPEPGRQMAAISSDLRAVSAFGVPAERVFGLWDWVGGRHSVWSAIGLPVAIGIGARAFRDFLAGAAAMDRHFRTAPAEGNLPLLLGLAGIWRRNAMGWPSVALVPYDQRLARLPAYVQQLAMESNGKGVTRHGAPVARATAPVVWGEPGTDAQHSFFQLLHQGTDIVPVDFILSARPRRADPEHHRLLQASCLAQAQALALGRTEAEARAAMAAEGAAPAEIERLAPHRTFPGDRPSTLILQRELDPYGLGRLIALYEHKTFVEGVLWDVDSFSQWGVELGKSLARRMLPALQGAKTEGLDPATAGLVRRLRQIA